MDALDSRQHGFLNRLVEPYAVLRRVREPVLLLVGEVAEVVESGVACRLLAQVVHLVEDAGDLVALLDVRPGAQLERALPDRPLGRLEKWEKLRRCLLLPVPLDGHGADQLRPLGGQP